MEVASKAGVVNSGRMSGHAKVAITLVIAWVLLCIPIFAVKVPPFIDYPNHLARCFMLAHSGYEQFFQADWALIPNLAMELIVVPLAHILPIALAGKIFFALMFAVAVYSGARLNKALTGDWSILGLAPALLLYNRVLSYGFLSYLFGVALLPLALALHIENRDKPWRRFAFDLIFCAILFVSHLAAFGLFIVCAAVYDLARMKAEGNWKGLKIDVLNLLAPVVLAGALIVLASPTASQASHIHFNFAAKPKLFLASLQTGIGIWDYAFVGLLIAAFAFFAFKKQLKLAPYIVPILAAVFVLYLIAPDNFKDSRFMDSRLPIVIGILLLCAIKKTELFNARLVGGILAALLLFRVATTTKDYRSWSKSLNTVAEDTKKIPTNSIVLTTKEGSYGFTDLDGWTPRLRFQEDEMLSHRPAYIQDVFTFKGQQPLTNTPPYDKIDLPTMLGKVDSQVLDNYLAQAHQELSRLGLADKPTYVYYIKTGGKLPPMSGAEIVVERSHYAILHLTK